MSRAVKGPLALGNVSLSCAIADVLSGIALVLLTNKGQAWDTAIGTTVYLLTASAVTSGIVESAMLVRRSQSIGKPVLGILVAFIVLIAITVLYAGA